MNFLNRFGVSLIQHFKGNIVSIHRKEAANTKLNAYLP